MRVLLVLLVLVPVACGSDDEAAPPPPSVSTSTTRPSTAPAIGDCPGRPRGSSPATFDGDAGVYAAQRVTVGEGGTLRFDVVQWLGGRDADEAYRRETGDASGAPNDYFILDQSDRLRTAPVAADARIYALGAPGQADSLHLVRLEGLHVERRTFWLTFVDGEITQVCEQYRP